MNSASYQCWVGTLLRYHAPPLFFLSSKVPTTLAGKRRCDLNPIYDQLLCKLGELVNCSGDQVTSAPIKTAPVAAPGSLR